MAEASKPDAVLIWLDAGKPVRPAEYSPVEPDDVVIPNGISIHQWFNNPPPHKIVGVRLKEKWCGYTHHAGAYLGTSDGGYIVMYHPEQGDQVITPDMKMYGVHGEWNSHLYHASERVYNTYECDDVVEEVWIGPLSEACNAYRKALIQSSSTFYDWSLYGQIVFHPGNLHKYEESLGWFSEGSGS